MRRKLFFICIVLSLLLLFTCIITVDAEDMNIDLGIHWSCPVCGRDNDNRFCPSCGYEARLWICGSCGSINSESFCPKCGWHKLTSQDQIFGTWIEIDNPSEPVGGLMLCFRDKNSHLEEAYTPTYIYCNGLDFAGCGAFVVNEDYGCIVCLDRQDQSMEAYSISVSPDGNTIAMAFLDTFHMLTRSESDSVSISMPSSMEGFAFPAGDKKEAYLCPYGNIIDVNNRFLPVLYYQNHSLRVSRIVGMPGEVISIHDNELYVNQMACDGLNMFYGKGSCDDFGLVVVPDDCYFVLNDNRQDTADSRTLDSINRKYIVGSIAQSYSNAAYAFSEDFSVNPYNQARGIEYRENAYIPVGGYAVEATIDFAFTDAPITSTHTVLDISTVEGREKTYLVPSILTEERYEQLTSQMKKATKKKLSSNYFYCEPNKIDKVKDLDIWLQQYPIILEQPVYLLKSDISEENMAKVESYFAEVGYTEDDLAMDMPSGDLPNNYAHDSFQLLVPDAKVICLKPEIIHDALYIAREMKKAFCEDSDDIGNIIARYGITDYHVSCEDDQYTIEYNLKISLE